jgi:ABC-type uncharacterized transport system substrate-binding protein
MGEELVQLTLKVTVSAPLPANLAVHRTTTKIPLVMANGVDPIGFGLVLTLSHPRRQRHRADEGRREIGRKAA